MRGKGSAKVLGSCRPCTRCSIFPEHLRLFVSYTVLFNPQPLVDYSSLRRAYVRFTSVMSTGAFYLQWRPHQGRGIGHRSATQVGQPGLVLVRVPTTEGKASRGYRALLPFCAERKECEVQRWICEEATLGAAGLTLTEKRRVRPRSLIGRQALSILPMPGIWKASIPTGVRGRTLSLQQCVH